MSYRRPFFFFNKHVETIFPALSRHVDFTFQKKERVSTPDNDFLDTAFSTQHADQLVIISHGLEGDAARPYVKGMAKACFDEGFDVLAWNYRGCGSEMNHQLRFYHSGATDDLNTIIDHCIQSDRYASIHLIGFSLGGNITLKYVGEDRVRSARIDKVIAFSVPLDLNTSCDQLMQFSNVVYHRRFLKSLKNKILEKSKRMAGLDASQVQYIKTLKAFDDQYTSVLHGFKNAEDYYKQCSALQFLQHIRNKTLIVNAANDPFLSKECYPVELLKDHDFVRLEIPLFGGHVGFTQFNQKKRYWSEQRAIEFLKS